MKLIDNQIDLIAYQIKSEPTLDMQAIIKCLPIRLGPEAPSLIVRLLIISLLC